MGIAIQANLTDELMDAHAALYFYWFGLYVYSQIVILMPKWLHNK